LSNKHLDFLVLNSLNDYGAGFGLDTNKITIIDKDKSVTQFSLKTKKEVATDIVNYIEQKLK
jgi:phosphopantothenoylcysteine decarboxylase/phosphopantothenate--cysteine ligase